YGDQRKTPTTASMSEGPDSYRDRGCRPTNARQGEWVAHNRLRCLTQAIARYGDETGPFLRHAEGMVKSGAGAGGQRRKGKRIRMWSARTPTTANPFVVGEDANHGQKGYLSKVIFSMRSPLSPVA